jgi:hypothetical protein
VGGIPESAHRFAELAGEVEPGGRLRADETEQCVSQYAVVGTEPLWLPTGKPRSVVVAGAFTESSTVESVRL